MEIFIYMSNMCFCCGTFFFIPNLMFICYNILVQLYIVDFYLSLCMYVGGNVLLFKLKATLASFVERSTNSDIFSG